MLIVAYLDGQWLGFRVGALEAILLAIVVLVLFCLSLIKKRGDQS